MEHKLTVEQLKIVTDSFKALLNELSECENILANSIIEPQTIPVALRHMINKIQTFKNSEDYFKIKEYSSKHATTNFIQYLNLNRFVNFLSTNYTANDIEYILGKIEQCHKLVKIELKKIFFTY